MNTPKRDAKTIAELAAARADMTGAIARHIDYLVDAYATAEQPLSVAEASQRARTPLPAPLTDTERDPEQVSWHTLGTLIEHEPEQGAALWKAIKQAARLELLTGTRTAKAREPTMSDPFQRAQFLAVLESLNESLKPRGGAERLLVQQLATAYDQWLKWQTIATQRIDQEAWTGERDRRRMIENMSKRDRERYEYEHGWMPPRVNDIEAIDQAVMIADRHQRAFLRLLRALQMMRSRIGTVVMTGGQLNVAEQQVVLPAADSSPSS